MVNSSAISTRPGVVCVSRRAAMPTPKQWKTGRRRAR